MRTETYTQKARENDDKVAATMKKKQEDLQLRRTLDLIKEGDKQENIARVNKMQDYNRQKLVEKINQKGEKVARMK